MSEFRINLGKPSSSLRVPFDGKQCLGTHLITDASMLLLHKNQKPDSQKEE